MVPKRPHDAYDMNAKVNSLWGNIATKEKKLERPKVRRSMIYSVRKTHWEDRDSEGIKRVMRRPGYVLKNYWETRRIP